MASQIIAGAIRHGRAAATCREYERDPCETHCAIKSAGTTRCFKDENARIAMSDDCDIHLDPGQTLPTIAIDGGGFVGSTLNPEYGSEYQFASEVICDVNHDGLKLVEAPA